MTKMMETLRLYVANACGLYSKLGDLRNALTHHQPDIAVLTETKFTAEKVSHSASCIPGYHAPLRLDRTAHGGGVAVWVKSALAFKHLESIKSCDHEVLWLSVITSTRKRAVIGAVYRPGSCADSDTELLEYLDATLDIARSHGSHIILAGDFNVHSESWLGSTKTTRAGDYTEDMCSVHGLVQHVRQPTRGLNVLDLIMSDIRTQVKVEPQPPLGSSDHDALVADFAISLHRDPKTSRTVWRYNKSDWPRLKHFYRSTDWSALLCSSPDTANVQITERILEGMKKFIPSKCL